MWLELYVLTLGILSLYLVYFRPYHAFQELGQGKMTSEPCSPNPSKFYLKKLKESKFDLFSATPFWGLKSF